MLLTAGVAWLAGNAPGRTRVFGWSGFVAGLVVVAGLVAAGPYVYDAGLVGLVTTGVVLFVAETARSTDHPTRSETRS